MGFYLNPSEQTKEDFLQEHGVKIEAPFWPTRDDVALVCWIDNGPFAAAGVAYSEAEMKEFNDPSDPRFRIWYLVAWEKIWPVVDSPDYLRKLMDKVAEKKEKVL